MTIAAHHCHPVTFTPRLATLSAIRPLSTVSHSSIDSTPGHRFGGHAGHVGSTAFRAYLVLDRDVLRHDLAPFFLCLHLFMADMLLLVGPDQTLRGFRGNAGGGLGGDSGII